jgi:hypothetical protein
VGLELTFNGFNFSNNSNKILRVQSVQSFVNVIRKFIYQHDPQTLNFMPGNTNSSAPFTVAIVSSYWDKVNTNYKHDTGLEPLEYLIEVATAIAGYKSNDGQSIIESVDDAFVAPLDTRRESMQGFRERDIRKFTVVCRDVGIH